MTTQKMKTKIVPLLLKLMKRTKSDSIPTTMLIIDLKLLEQSQAVDPATIGVEASKEDESLLSHRAMRQWKYDGELNRGVYSRSISPPCHPRTSQKAAAAAEGMASVGDGTSG
jgi:hypothetical protein